MSNALPEPDLVLRAVDLYLSRAYFEGTPLSRTVQALVDVVRAPHEPFFSCPPFTMTEQNGRARYTLRLGNRFYQHMKLVIEPAPDDKSSLFKADAHDRHLCLPPDHPEAGAVLAMRVNNEHLATCIEQDWMDAGVPTFKSYLRRDLERRKALAGGEIR